MSRHWIAIRLAMSVVALSAATSQPDATAPPLPPPGRLVDLGGWRLHIDCTGNAVANRPTVVLEAGVGDFSVEWSLVQPEIARFARVCSYDRAGSGWSDLGPRPRTMAQIVWELHSLLEKADERAPYLLVGHSFGGVLMELYASTYPAQVAGMVLVEPGSLNPLRFVNGKMTRPAEMATGSPIPAVKTSDPLRERDIPPNLLELMAAAAQENGAHANDPPRDKLPAAAQRMRAWGLSQIKTYAANDNPFEGEELARMRASQSANARRLNVPVAVLVRGVAEDRGPDAQAAEDDHRRELTALAGLYRRGEARTADRSGHHIQLEQPELVVATVQRVLAASRR